jgi:hypothetical protein
MNRRFRGYRSQLAAGLCFALLFSSMSATAQQVLLSSTAQPQSFEVRLEPYVVTGFGAVRFGMMPDEVKRVIGREFPGAELREEFDPVQRTPVLNLVLPALAPAEGVPPLGPVTLNYVFGHASGRLMAINLDWIVTDAEHDALVAAGGVYTASVAGYQWQPIHNARGHVTGASSVVLFAGRDMANAGLEVRLDGVPLEVLHPDGSVERRAAPGGGARLHIGLAQQPDRPDIYRLPDGTF